MSRATILRTLAVVLVAMTIGSTGASIASAQSAQFRGWIRTWKELSARIAPVDEPLDVERFLPAEDMEDLLGTWSTFGTEHNFRNGYPNSLSMMIWQVAMSSFADAVGRSCTKAELVFHPDFAATLAAVCAWPSAEARSDGTMRAFWLAMMGYNAPESEFAVWSDFIRRRYAGQAPSETVRAMTLAIVLHPHFLLHR